MFSLKLFWWGKCLCSWRLFFSDEDQDEGWELVRRNRRSHGGSAASLSSQGSGHFGLNKRGERFFIFNFELIPKLQNSETFFVLLFFVSLFWFYQTLARNNFGFEHNLYPERNAQWNVCNKLRG